MLICKFFLAISTYRAFHPPLILLIETHSFNVFFFLSFILFPWLAIFLFIPIKRHVSCPISNYKHTHPLTRIHSHQHPEILILIYVCLFKYIIFIFVLNSIMIIHKLSYCHPQKTNMRHIVTDSHSRNKDDVQERWKKENEIERKQMNIVTKKANKKIVCRISLLVDALIFKQSAMKQKKKYSFFSALFCCILMNYYYIFHFHPSREI